jgi:hypothetical protein
MGKAGRRRGENRHRRVPIKASKLVEHVRVLERTQRAAEQAIAKHRVARTSNRAGDAKKRAYHYTAKIKGDRPTRFYVGPSGDPARAAASAFSAWANAPVTLWPANERGVYRAQWFDPYADVNRETELTILEEYELGRPS